MPYHTLLVDIWVFLDVRVVGELFRSVRDWRNRTPAHLEHIPLGVVERHVVAVAEDGKWRKRRECARCTESIYMCVNPSNARELEGDDGEE